MSKGMFTKKYAPEYLKLKKAELASFEKSLPDLTEKRETLFTRHWAQTLTPAQKRLLSDIFKYCHLVWRVQWNVKDPFDQARLKMFQKRGFKIERNRYADSELLSLPQTLICLDDEWVSLSEDGFELLKLYDLKFFNA